MTRVLVVDDELLTRQLVRTVLEANDYEVLEAADGATALDLVASQHPDLVLLDVAMPGIDGIEVCRRVNGSCKVVMLTAHDDVATERASRDAGANAFLAKPFSSAELTEFAGKLHIPVVTLAQVQRLEHGRVIMAEEQEKTTEAQTGTRLRV